MSDFINRPQIEVLSAADGERRRYWSDDDKLRIVEESFIGHRQVAATARRHDICRSLLTTWRRQYRNGELGFLGTIRQGMQYRKQSVSRLISIKFNATLIACTCNIFGYIDAIFGCISGLQRKEGLLES